MTLEDFGWSPFFADQFPPLAARGLVPGRIVLEQRSLYTVFVGPDEIEAATTGRLRHHASSTGDLPAIGDWVAVRLRPSAEQISRIHAVLERRSKFSRKVAGARTDEQVVAANIDRLFIVVGLDGDFNLRRLERYLITAYESGTDPVIVLNKTDLADSVDERVAEVEGIALDVPVHAVSGLKDQGLGTLEPYLEPRKTIALVGSSGAGKSTLINHLYGEEIMRTAEVRASDDRGTHTTSHRQLLRLPNGALLIDNPGIRELQLWSVTSGLEDSFEDIQAIAAGCRFRDCEHQEEPGCAVLAAVAKGALSAERLEHLHQMQAELAFLNRRQDQRAQLDEKKRWKTIHKAARKHRPRSR